MTTRTAAGAMTLPQEYYTSPQLFGREIERIFAGRWIYCGRASALAEAGSYFVVPVGVDSIIVLRDGGGDIRAFYNVCRHRGTELCGAAGRFDGRIRCPYHAWTWDFEGRLLGAPAMDEVAGFDRADYPLHPVAAQLWEGCVFINLAPAPEPFARAFAPLVGKFTDWVLPDLETAHRTVYEVAANWKLLFQNYSECYHCPSAHPALNRLTPFRDSSNDLDAGPFLGGPMNLSRGSESMTLTGVACAAPLPGVRGAARRQVHYYTLFPNMFLSLHPDYVLIHHSEPLAADRTRIVCEWLFHPDAIAEDGFDPSGAVEFWDMTNRQDWQLCEAAQRGISSRAYTPGPYAELESQLAAFDREYLRVMDADA